MKRVFASYAYGPGPRDGCWWDQTCPPPQWPLAQGDMQTDVAIIGAGFTGLSCALHLADQGIKVTVLEAEAPGFGASARNGGFCCLGGSKLSPEALTQRYGAMQAQAYQAGEEQAVNLVEALIARHQIQVDRHSKGETVMAHSPGARRRLMQEDGAFIDGPDLRAAGLNGAFFAALTTPTGFALNPRKYLFGLARAASGAGADLFQSSPVQSLHAEGKSWTLTTPQARITASRVVVATNGYSNDSLLPWLAGRYMPAQSSILVTRPLSKDEQQTQGWTSAQMAYDTRDLLHYFRLMPDGRFLFGMRGGLRASPGAEQAIRRKLRRHFETLFPAWSHVESPNIWSGLVALSRNLVPFVGPVPSHPGLFAGLCYHGNGVAMGTYAGRLLADLVQGRTPDLPFPALLQQAGRFPLGRFRRLMMPPAYALLALKDRSDWISSAASVLSPRHRQ